MKKLGIVMVCISMMPQLSFSWGRHSIDSITPYSQTAIIVYSPNTIEVTKQYNLCIRAEVNWIFPDPNGNTGWQPDPFQAWVDMLAPGNKNDYFLDNDQSIRAKFSIHPNGNSSSPKDIFFGSSNGAGPVSGNSSPCNGQTTHILTAKVIVPNSAGLYGNTFTEKFILRTKLTYRNNTSQEEFELSAKVSDVAQVTGLKDLVLEQDGTLWTDYNDQVCVYSTLKKGNFGRYSVEARSDNGYELSMTNSKDTIPYTLLWKDATGNDWKAFGNDSFFKRQKGSLSPMCSSTKLSGVKVEAFDSDVQKVGSGVYSDKVEIIVRAE